MAKSFFAYSTVLALTLVIGFTPLAMGGRPLPYVSDEFSYLLAADTFAHGRLTNPPLPKPEYFQTFHELMTPTYASKYPPGQGLTLAAGQVFGNPLYGSIVTTALACVALVWMARGWLPIQWAMLAGVLASLHPLIRYWAQSYWSGSLGLLGGALVAGAMLRASRRPRWTSAVTLAAGVGILMNMRPLEGSIFTFVSGVYLISQWYRIKLPLSDILRFTALSAAAFVPFLAWTGYYNYRVTGSPFTTPYLLYAEHYQGVPSLFFQKPWPNYLDVNPRMAYYRDSVDGGEYRRQLDLAGYLTETGKKICALSSQWIYWVRLPLLLPLLWAYRDRKLRWATILTFVPVAIHLAITPWLRWHYLSPAGAAFFLLMAVGARQLSAIRGGRLVVLTVIAYAGWVTLFLVRVEAANTQPPGWARAHLIDQIKKVPGNHIVIVKYLPGPQQLFEWVYNDADLSSQRVIFANDRGPQTLDDLNTLFTGRQFWSLQIADLRFTYQPIMQNR